MPDTYVLGVTQPALMTDDQLTTEAAHYREAGVSIVTECRSLGFDVGPDYGARMTAGTPRWEALTRELAKRGLA